MSIGVWGLALIALWCGGCVLIEGLPNFLDQQAWRLKRAANHLRRVHDKRSRFVSERWMREIEQGEAE